MLMYCLQKLYIFQFNILIKARKKKQIFSSYKCDSSTINVPPWSEMFLNKNSKILQGISKKNVSLCNVMKQCDLKKKIISIMLLLLLRQAKIWFSVPPWSESQYYQIFLCWLVFLLKKHKHVLFIHSITVVN